MREIIFRGKRRYTGEWAESVCPLGVMHSGHLCDDFDPDTVGQYTGLDDNNGKRIFEGDIVKCRHSIFRMNADGFAEQKIRKAYDKEVIGQELGGFRCYYWRNYAVSIHDGRIRLQNGSDIHYAKWSFVYNHQIEVIGNIHDNPELLNGGEG